MDAKDARSLAGAIDGVSAALEGWSDVALGHADERVRLLRAAGESLRSIEASVAEIASAQMIQALLAVGRSDVSTLWPLELRRAWRARVNALTCDLVATCDPLTAEALRDAAGDGHGPSDGGAT